MATDATRTRTEADPAQDRREGERKRREAAATSNPSSNPSSNPFGNLFGGLGGGNGLFAMLGKLFSALLGGGGLLGDFTRSLSGNFSDFTDSVSGGGDTPLAPKGSTPHRSIGASLGSALRSGWNGVLDLIGKHESGGDYNRVYGKGIKRMDLTNMTIDQVLAWQENYTRHEGSASSAAGKYQIIRKTLSGLKDQMGLSGNEKFDQAMQDRMALKLLENRGIGKLKAETMTTAQIARAVHSISKEWASIESASGKSFYEGDGRNRAAKGSGQKVAAALIEALNNDASLQSVSTKIAAAAPVDNEVNDGPAGRGTGKPAGRPVFVGNYPAAEDKAAKVAAAAPIARRTVDKEGVFKGDYDGSASTQIAAAPAQKTDRNPGFALKT